MNDPKAQGASSASTEDRLREWIRDAVARLSAAPDTKKSSVALTLNRPFRELGLGSQAVTSLIAQLSSFAGVPISVTAAWEHPTPEALLQYVTRLTSGVSVTPKAAGAATNASASRSFASEPIAIVGMGCRLPGGVRSPSDYWKLLCAAESGIREVPSERWDIADYLDEDLAAPGKMTTRWGGFLDDVANFDADFFGISPREARQMDPQQRLALELAWEALEDARMRPQKLRGQAVAVYLGAMGSDYSHLTHGAESLVDSHTATGQDTSIISARISYVLGLEGASLASTRPVRHRSSRSISRARASARATARWPWPAACISCSRRTRPSR